MKRMLCLILTLVLLVGMVPLAAFAETPDTQLQNHNLTVEGTNGFGNLLSEEINEQQENEAEGCVITGLEIEGDTAKVTFSTMEDAVLMVGIYTEDGLQLLTSAKTEVTEEETECYVTLEGNMPQYFYACAFLLDAYDHSPLCPSYDTPMYTKEMQDLLASTTADYDADRVLNFDEDETTNFAVFGEKTIVIEETECVNTVISADDENATYVIDNADSTIKNLRKGNVLAYPYGEDQLLLVKVASVKVNGNTVTITGQDVQMEEVFSHVKMEQTGETSMAEVDTSACPDGVVYEGMTAEGASTYALRAGGDFGTNYYLNYKFLKEELMKGENKYFEGDITLSGTAGFSLDFKVTYYVTANRQFLEFKTDVGVKTEVELEGSGKIKLPLGELKFYFYGIGIGMEPELQLECKASVKLSFFAGWTFGFSYEAPKGFQNLTGKPKVDADFKVEGTLFFGIDFAPTVDLAGGMIAEGKVNVPVGFELEAKMDGSNFEKEKPDGDWTHECESCVDMELKFKGEISTKLQFLKSEKWELKSKTFYFTVKISKAYWSMDKDEAGWGICPYKKFRVTVLATDKDEKPVANTAVDAVWREGYQTVSLGTTNNAGVTTKYLQAGTYTFLVDVDGEELRRTEVIEDARQIEMNKELIETLKKMKFQIEADAVIDGGALTVSGMCGDNVTWTLYDSGLLLIQGSGPMVDFFDPATGGDIEVAAEDIPWFSRRGEINRVIIGNGVTNIGAIAFIDCANLVSITIPDSVTTIGVCAFAYCKSLDSVTLPYGVTTIEDEAFYNCTGLNDIILPTTLIHLGAYVFSRCSSLESITIPDSVTSIPERTFNECKALTSVKLPNTLTSIGNYAFYYCYALNDLEIPDSVTTIGEQAFYDCRELTELNIPNSITRIGPYAFSNCRKPESVSIPDSITSLADGIFSGCESLTNVVIPDSVTSIGKSAFERCKKLINIEILNSVTSIGSYAFGQCAALENIEIPDSVTTLGNDAFFRCTSLTNIVIPDSVNTIENNTFYECSSLTSITIPNSVTKIGSKAFYRCTSLPRIEIPNGVTLIDDYAFDECTNLTDITIPDSVTEIGSYIFRNCTGLTSMELPYGLKSISRGAFYNCSNLTSVTIPDSVTYIDKGAFQGCSCLTDVYYAGSKLLWGRITVYANNTYLKNANIHCTDGTILSPMQVMAISEVDALEEEPAVLEEVIEKTEAVDSPVFYAVFGGEYSTDSKGVKTARFSGLVPGAQYVLLALADLEAENVLASQNLLYIAQKEAAEDGALEFTYVQRVDTDLVYVVACGASNKNLQDAVITFPEMYQSQIVRAVDLTVTYNGEELTEGLDYVLLGKTDYSTAGAYTCYIRGIRNYTGLVECRYTVEEGLRGDLDGNGIVDDEDVIYLLWHTLMPDDYAVNQNVDYDSNGIVDDEDVIYLLWHTLMPDDYPL